MAKSSLCSIPDCGKPTKARGLCSAHYQRQRTYGHPLGGGPSRAPVGSLLKWMQSNSSYGGAACLRWPFAYDTDGYAKMRFQGQQMRAHRVMCIIAHGSPPNSTVQAAHNCGKGHEGCLNPNHLRWAEPIDNHADKQLHGTVMRGSLNGKAKITESDAKAILSLRGTLTQPEIAKQFGVSRATVCSIHNGRNWGWMEENTRNPDT